jgi:hypothetical protein
VKTALILLLLTLPAAAQLSRHDLIVGRLESDLRLGDFSRFVMDLNRSYPNGLGGTKEIGTALDIMLAGRTLTEEISTPLANGILEGFEAAVKCRDDESPLIESERFRDAIRQVYDPLTKLGVSVPETQAFLRLYYRDANRVANPVVRVIPK